MKVSTKFKALVWTDCVMGKHTEPTWTLLIELLARSPFSLVMTPPVALKVRLMSSRETSPRTIQL